MSKLKIESYEGREQKIILTGLIVNEDLLREISARYEPELFPDRWSNLVCQWCVQYYNKYRKAPNKNINNLFHRWANKTKDEQTTELVDRFLDSLGGEYKKLRKEIHAAEVLDLAITFFNKNKLAKLSQEIEQYLDIGDVTGAEKIYSDYKPIQADTEDFFNPYLDKDLHKTVYHEKIEPLIKLSGPMGKFFGDQLRRENFIALQGPEKAGKSFWLQEICHQAARSRVNVMFFGIGDMSKTQTMRRYQERLARRPIKRPHKKYIWKPVGWKSRNAEGLILPRRTKLKIKRDITLKEIENARRKFEEHVLRSSRDLYRVSCQPSMSLAQIRNSIQKTIEKESWHPAVLAIDYADLLDPPVGIRDKLDQIDDNWRRMRNLALEFNCLVLTATQVKRTAYRKLWQSLDDVADQKKKAAHITGLIGINSLEIEDEQQVRRLNWIRTREYVSTTKVVCAGCLGMANPCVTSTYWGKRS